jgi:hypothetical protein
VAKYTLLTRNEYPSTTPERQGMMDVVYVYMDERTRTVTFTIPRDEDNPERVKQELVEAQVREAAGGPAVVEI